MIELYNLKEFCLSDYGVQKVNFKNSYAYEQAKKGKPMSSFGYLTAGSGSLFTYAGKTEVRRGQLMFIPEGTRYHSLWQGDPEVEYYCLHVSFRTIGGKRLEQRHGLTIIDPPAGMDCESFFLRQFELSKAGTPQAAMAAISEFYSFFEAIEPYMESSSPHICSTCVSTALEYIEKNYTKNFNIDTVAKACFVSTSHLFHLFKDELGITPVEYKNEVRIRNALDMLANSKKTIEDISAELGFNSPGYFRKTFTAVTGMTPSGYRKKLLSD